MKTESKPIISLSDYPGEVSLFLPIEKCSHFCPWCFNKKSFPKEPSFSNFKREIFKNKDNVNAIIFGAGDPLEESELVYSLAEYARSLGLKTGIQLSTIPLFHINRINENFDYISFTLNSIREEEIENLKKIKGKTEIKIIYIPKKTEYPKNVPIDVVQGFIPGECLDSEYNKIHQPLYSEVMEYAKNIKASFVITKEGGRERVL